MCLGSFMFYSNEFHRPVFAAMNTSATVLISMSLSRWMWSNARLVRRFVVMVLRRYVLIRFIPSYYWRNAHMWPTSLVWSEESPWLILYLDKHSPGSGPTLLLRLKEHHQPPTVPSSVLLHCGKILGSLADHLYTVRKCCRCCRPSVPAGERE